MRPGGPLPGARPEALGAQGRPASEPGRSHAPIPQRAVRRDLP